MSDQYEATYNAHGGDAAARDNAQAAFNRRIAALEALEEARRPSVIWRPTLSLDGDQWCALYGEDLQEGVAGFGDTPEEAMQAFDEAWKNG